MRRCVPGAPSHEFGSALVVAIGGPFRRGDYYSERLERGGGRPHPIGGGRNTSARRAEGPSHNLHNACLDQMSTGMLASADRTLVEMRGSGCLVDDQASREAHPQMLVLTRKSNQSIMIGDDIEVSVLAIMGEKVRIGIQAPRDIPVFRKEVYLEIQQERLGSGKGVREEVDAALRGLGEGT